MTKEERHLWFDFLKSLPIGFHRQKGIGNYIVDFYCARAKLIIELDGSQHYDTPGIESDAALDKYLCSLGLTVKRYSNADINSRFTASARISAISSVTVTTEPPHPALRARGPQKA